MNVQAMARRGYAAQATPTRSARSMEYEVIARVTHRLRNAALKRRSDYPGLVRALHDNRQLWTLLAGDVADDANGLAPGLRAQLFYLAEFTHVHTSRVLNKKDSVAPLIEINTSILRGLRQAPEAS